MSKIKDHEDLIQNLKNFTFSPNEQYSDEEWEIVCKTVDLLKLLEAEFKLILSENNVTDHTEIAMSAEYALGENDNPSDLLLKLDLSLKHLLIDEFQDTSNTQYDLIEKLISGWETNDGRTLFIVGDPMQSIYGFRRAEVGLFIRARDEGIADIKLDSLTLNTNFRSLPSIVDWVNKTFSKIFPKTEDIAVGKIAYKPSAAARGQVFHHTFGVHMYDERPDPLQIIQQLQAEFIDDTIAILVKKRNDASEILKLLRINKINFEAIDIEKLSESRVILDLLALTRALLSPIDRIAWLSILRAPLCGLNLTDLHKIATYKYQTIFENICHVSELNLSEDGILKLKVFLPKIEDSLKNNMRPNFAKWVENTWLKITNEPLEKDAEIYFKLLEKNEYQDIWALEKELAKLYINETSGSNLKIMTIHSAKGLDFDHVIIPALEKGEQRDEQKLLLWQERARLHKGFDLLIAPIKAKSSKSSPTYEYFKNFAKPKIKPRAFGIC